MANSSKNVVELEIEDIEGVGPTTARKMKEAGISSVMELATAVADELATDLGGSKDTAATFIMAAQKLVATALIILFETSCRITTRPITNLRLTASRV